MADKDLRISRRRGPPSQEMEVSKTENVCGRNWSLKLLKFSRQKTKERRKRRKTWGRRERCVMRRSFCDFLKEEDKEETEILYKGEKDELTFLQPLQLELGSIMSLIRRFREPISVFLLSSLSLSLSLSLRFPVSLFKTPVKVSAIQLTRPYPRRHCDAHRESKLSS